VTSSWFFLSTLVWMYPRY